MNTLKPTVLESDIQAAKSFGFANNIEDGYNKLSSSFKANPKLNAVVAAGSVVAGVALYQLSSHHKDKHLSKEEESYTEISEGSEHLATTLAYGFAGAKALPHAYKEYKNSLSNDSSHVEALSESSQSFFHNIEENGGININLYGAGAAAYSLIKGQTSEEKAQGFGIWARESSANYAGNKLGQLAKEFLPEKYQAAGSFLAHTAGTLGVGQIFAPYFNWGAARVGRILNLAASDKAEQAQTENSNSDPTTPAPQLSSSYGATKTSQGHVMTKSVNGHANIKTRISDQKISQRDIDEMQARKIVHGYAF